MDELMIPDAEIVDHTTYGRLNITWNGANGELPDRVARDTSNAELLRMAEEALQTGYVPGIPAVVDVDLTGYVVDRPPASDAVPDPFIFIMPKTPVG